MAAFSATLSGLPPTNIPTRGRREARQPRAVVRSPCRAFPTEIRRCGTFCEMIRNDRGSVSRSAKRKAGGKSLTSDSALSYNLPVTQSRENTVHAPGRGIRWFPGLTLVLLILGGLMWLPGTGSDNRDLPCSCCPADSTGPAECPQEGGTCPCNGWARTFSIAQAKIFSIPRLSCTGYTGQKPYSVYSFLAEQDIFHPPET